MIKILDGAMGTMIQSYGLEEEDFRHGLELPQHPPLKGCNDILVLTRPDVIEAIHRQYIEAGADIIETDSFNANAVSLAEYGIAHMVADINRAAALVARKAADAELERTGRKVLVAGSMGPSGVSLSLEAEEGQGEGITGFDRLRSAWTQQAVALIEGGVDLLLIETVFDTLNAKAALAAVRDAMQATGKEVPVMVSVTLTEQGRTLSGQSLRAFVNTVLQYRPWSIGLNCGFGPDKLGAWLEELHNVPCLVSMHPNAGLPDEMGRYTQTPAMMAHCMGEYLERGLANIVGGCCGTTPAHIRAIAEEVRKHPERKVPEDGNHSLLLAGLDPCTVENGFLKVGERCNVAGSRKFLRLVSEGNLTEALDVARAQVAKGARILDVNMDDGMLDAAAEMERFVTLLGSDSVTAQLPVMIDSSDINVIRRALRRIQGRPIVNSISLKEGEEAFLEHAREIRDLGAAMVVMAFDEEGQATTVERRKEICARAYKLLTEKAGVAPNDIVFDPNVLTIATGMEEHDRYALDFLESVEWIKGNLPGARVSGGVSNLSFAFRGHNKVREAMHTVFLHHAIARGMDMAIVNPATPVDASTVDPALRKTIEDLIFMRDPHAADKLMETAMQIKAEADKRKAEKAAAGPASPSMVNAGEEQGVEAALSHLIGRGLDNGLEPLLQTALEEKKSAMAVVKEALMPAMERVGEAFGAGRMFLPQVVRSAAVMKKAINWLTPFIEEESGNGNRELENGTALANRTFILATVKGDVHDIGKNIVAVVLRCSGFEVVDLGVMVPPEKIIEEVKRRKAAFVGLSGLITPSLAEMTKVASMLEEEGLTDTVLFVGGATTSPLHTAVKIAPLFSGLTVHTRDAAGLPPYADALADPARRPETSKSITLGQQELRTEYEGKQAGKNQKREKGELHYSVGSPAFPYGHVPDGFDKEYGTVELLPLINWRAFLHGWGMDPNLHNHLVGTHAHTDAEGIKEAARLINDAEKMIDWLQNAGAKVAVRIRVHDAAPKGESILIGASHINHTSGSGGGHEYGHEYGCPCCSNKSSEKWTLDAPRRHAADGTPGPSMADYIATDGDTVAFFAATTAPLWQRVHELKAEGKFTPDEYQSLLLQSVADRLVEAATEKMHSDYNGGIGIRPAVGYPALPDQLMVHRLDNVLHYDEMGVKLTENGAMWPQASTTGLIISHPEARY